MAEIKCPCGWREYMEDEDCKKVNCDDCCPLLTPTNADRIRAMSDEEMKDSVLATHLGYAPWCDYHCENKGDDGCDRCIEKWLKQPAEVDNG